MSITKVNFEVLLQKTFNRFSLLTMVERTIFINHLSYHLLLFLLFTTGYYSGTATAKPENVDSTSKWFVSFFLFAFQTNRAKVSETYWKVSIAGAEKFGMTTQRVELLCANSTADAASTIHCFTRLKEVVAEGAAVELCGGLVPADVEALKRCVSTLQAEQFVVEDIMRICKTSAAGIFPEQCVLHSKMWTSLPIKIERCAGSCNATATDTCYERWRGANETEKRLVCARCFGSNVQVNSFIHCVEDARSQINSLRTLSSYASLCALVTNESAADTVLACAVRCPTLRGLEASEILEVEDMCVSLCQSATNEGPGLCLAAFWDLKRPSETVGFHGVGTTLCERAFSKEPVLCFHSESISRVEDNRRAEMCRFTDDHRGRLECLLHPLEYSPMKVDDADRAQLCSKRSSKFPSVCLSEMLQRLHWKAASQMRNVTAKQKLIEVCSSIGTKQEMTLVERCLDRFASRWIDNFGLIPILQACAKLPLLIQHRPVHAKELEELASVPAKCVEVASKHLGSGTTIDFLTLCSSSPTTAPGECFNELSKPRSSGIPHTLLSKLCSVVFNPDPYATISCVSSLPRQLPESVAYSLCANATIDTGAAIASCYIDAPESFTDVDKVTLCGAWHNTGYQAVCAHAARGKLSGSAVALLCRHAKSAGPGRCALRQAESKRLEEADILALCKDARDDAPAACVSEDRFGSLPPQALVVLCKSATNSSLPHHCLRAASSSALSEMDKAELCAAAVSSEAAICANSRTVSMLRPSLIVQLCAKSTNGTAKMVCFETLNTGAAGATPLSESEAVLLCTNATSALPIQCYSRLARLCKPFAVEFCQGVSREAQINCVARAIRSGVKSHELLQKLCETGSDEATSVCVEKAPSDLNETQVFRLCFGSEYRGEHKNTQDAFAVQCLKSYHLAQWETDEAIQLCGAAKSVDPLLCIEEIQSAGVYVANSVLAKLCRLAESTAPAACFLGIHSSNQLKEADMVELCAQVNNIGPAECASSSQFQLPSRLVLSLCKDASSIEPFHCFQDATNQFPDFLKVALCTQADSRLPAYCAARVQTSLTDFEKVNLCRNAKTIAPALCANEVPNGLLSAFALVKLCKNALDATPAHCIAHIEETKGKRNVNDTDLSFCKDAQAYAHRFKAMFPRRLNPKVLSSLNDILPLTAVVVDQFGYPLRKDLANVSIVQVEVLTDDPLRQVQSFRNAASSFMRRARTVTTTVPISKDEDGVGQAGECFEGCMHAKKTPNSFVVDDVALNAFGTLWLTVHLRQGELDWIQPLAVKFYRDMSYKDMQASLLDCSRIPQNYMQSNLLPPNMECSNIIPMRYAFMALSKQCVAELSEEMAVEVTTAKLKNRICALLDHGPAKLILEIDTPLVEMNATERLKLPEHHTQRELRKAYRTESAKWHPDRWVDFRPKIVELATDKYLLIREAYEILSVSHLD